MKRVALFMACVALAAAQALPSYKDLKYPPLAQVKITGPDQVTLANGMRVLLLEDHELPLIQGLALVHTGNLFDPPDKRGLSTVMAEVMRSGGTRAKTGDQIDEQLENIAGSVESSMDETSASHQFFRTEGERRRGAFDAERRDDAARVSTGQNRSVPDADEAAPLRGATTMPTPFRIVSC